MKRLICTAAAVAALVATSFAQEGNGAPPDYKGQLQPDKPAAPDAVLGERGCIGPGRTCPSPIDRPSLFFKAEFKQPAGKEHPAAPGDVINPNLIVRFYGPDAKNIQVAGTDVVGGEGNVSWLDPSRIWTGLTNSATAVTFADKERYVDLTRRARIGWTGRASGFHVLRPVIKLADGTYLMGDHGFSGTQHDYTHEEFVIKDINWRRLDITRMVTVGEWPTSVDLTQVDEVGFGDLLPGSGHGEGGFVAVVDMSVWAQPGKRR